MPLPPYTADADDDTKPLDSVSGGYAARELRAVKTKLNIVEATADSAASTATTANSKATNNSTCLGVSNATHMGAFSGVTIPDDQTVKQALQALETALEALVPGIDAANAYTMLGRATTDVDMGTFTGTTLSDNSTVKQCLQDIETAFEAFVGGAGAIDGVARGRIDNLASILGRAYSDTDMGNIAGDIFTDNASIKTILDDFATWFGPRSGGRFPNTWGGKVNYSASVYSWNSGPSTPLFLANPGPATTLTRLATGRVQWTHNLGTVEYTASILPYARLDFYIFAKTANDLTIQFLNPSGTATDAANGFEFVIMA